MSNSPYEPSPPPVPANAKWGSDLSVERPKIWVWYLAYCGFMALVYFLCFVGGIFMLLNADWLAAESDEDRVLFVVQGILFSSLGAVLFALFAVVPFLPRKKGAWMYGFVTICLGMTSACCLPMTIPLIIFWIKDDTKRFFNVS